MKLYRLDDVPIRPDDIVCKYPPWRAAFSALWMLVFAAVPFAFVPHILSSLERHPDDPLHNLCLYYFPWFVISWNVLLFGFFIPLICWQVLKTSSKSSWIMRWNESGLTIKFSSFFNNRLREEKDIVAVGFSWSEIEWIAHRPIQMLLPRSAQQSNKTYGVKFQAHYLDIKLKDCDLRPLQQAMDEEEARPKSWHSKSSSTWYVGFDSASHKSYVYVIDHDIIRLVWRVPGKYLAPAPQHVIQALSDKIAIRPQVDEQTNVADQKKMQEILLREWVKAGKTIEAIAVAKELYRISQSEAERMVKELKTADKQTPSIG